ncbi:MAG: hypothetical protein WBA61_08940, partial [Aequorivita sp.]
LSIAAGPSIHPPRFTCRRHGGHSGTCVHVIKSKLAHCGRTAIQNISLSHNATSPLGVQGQDESQGG